MKNLLWKRREKEITKMAQCFWNENHCTRNLLFLDFDGVINGPGFSVEKGNVVLYHRDAVELLNEVCLDCDVNIVVSSFWRHMGLDYCRKYLYDAGIDQSIPVIDTTGREIPHHREREIWEYLERHRNFTNFVILDDLDMEYLSDYHVMTNPGSCLQKKDAEAVRELFRRNMWSK